MLRIVPECKARLNDATLTFGLRMQSRIFAPKVLPTCSKLLSPGFYSLTTRWSCLFRLMDVPTGTAKVSG